MSANLAAVRGALSLLGAGATPATKTAVSNTIPTAKTRAALDLLAANTAEQLVEKEINLRELAVSLFNWSNEPKATKNVMRSLNTALNTPGKYAHAVELTAYISALVPLLQPDRLARLFGALDEVNNAYAPSRYTLQFSHKLERLLKEYPEERREKLAYSLWVQSHTGRWWDLTAGQNAAVVEVEGEGFSRKDLIDLFSQHKLTWTPATAEQFSKLQADDELVESLEKYNEALQKEKLVDPDTGVLASHLSWLKPLERPESPVGSLLDNLHEIISDIDYKMPEKPKSFSEMFPNIKLYGGTRFPFPTSVLVTDGKTLLPGVRLELVNNATQLADNRTYMGNCTWGYKGRMEKGEYVLFRILDGENVYNGSMIADKNGQWRLGELNSRFNRGDVPTKVRTAFSTFIGSLPPAVPDNEMTRQNKAAERMKEFTNHKFKYRI